MGANRKQHDDQASRVSASSDQTSPVASALAGADHDNRDARTLRAMQALTDTALSHLSLEALLPELLERVQSVMRVDNAAILLRDDDTDDLVVRAARGPEENLIGQIRIPVGVGFAGRVAASRAPLRVDDLSTFPVSNPMLREKLRSMLGVPLLAGDRVLGVVHIGSATSREFTDADTVLLEQVADRVARAVERSQLFAAANAARQAAERRAAFLSATLEALGDGLAIADAAGNITYSNPAFLMLQGATAMSVQDTGSDSNGAERPTVPPDGSDRLRRLNVRDAQGNPLPVQELAIARALRGETLAGPTALEVQIRRLDGQDAFLSLSAAPVNDASGNVLGAVLAVRDVTERHRLERQAREASRQARERAARLEAIFAAVADGLFVYDAEGRVVERNPAAAGMQVSFAPPGAREESVYERGRHISGGLRDASGRQLSEEEWPQARIARGEVLVGASSVDIRMRRRDGQDSYLNVSGAPLFDDAGAIAGSVCLYRDLTERWELNEMLQRRTRDLEAANRQLLTLLDVLPIGVSIVDASGKPLLVNDALRRIWGQDLLISESMAQYGEYKAWRTDTGQPVAADEWGLARALTAGVVSVGQEYDIETFDGQRKTILDSAAPLRDEAGAITGAVSVIFDITERRKAEVRTREALEAFIVLTRALVEGPDALGNTSDSGDGPAADGATTPHVHNENPLAHRLAQLTRSILGCNLVAVSAVEEVNGRLLDRPFAIVGLTPEQERKWWVEQLALQPHEVGTGMLPEDRERLLAGEVFTADLTRPPYQVPNDYGVTAILGAVMRAQGRIVGMLALDFDDPSGEPHVFTAEEIQIAEAVARLGAVVLERDRLLRERQAARAEALALTEANRRMDEFLGIAGHELRTPLTTVKANLQLAERRARMAAEAAQRPIADVPGPAPAAESEHIRGLLDQLLRLLGRAAQSVERQERLVQDLLDVSRISAGRLEFRMASQDLTALVRETVEEQRMSAPGRRIELHVPEKPVRVIADADRVGQVLTNYLTNALKYSEADRPVAVSVCEEGSFARVEVRDQGPGISREQLPNLFGRFHRVPAIEVVSGSGVGLGLGLYISKTIVEQHGGAVGVESVEGDGSTFWFSLPLSGTETAATAPTDAVP